MWSMLPVQPVIQPLLLHMYSKNWGETKCTHFAAHVMPPTSKATDCICIRRAFNHDIDRNIGNHNHVAQWKTLRASSFELKVGNDIQQFANMTTICISNQMCGVNAIPLLVEKYLTPTEGFTGVVTKGDRICSINSHS